QRRVGVVGGREVELADQRHGRPYFFLGLIACLRPAPAVNLGALEALIFTRSPVRGLTPWRAARLTTENLPKPVMLTSSPFLRFFVTVASTDSIARAESALLRPLSEATASTSWDLFIYDFLSACCLRGDGTLPRELLARIQEVLGVERQLDPLVQLDRALRPLARELAALEQPHPVLPRDRPAEL